MEMDAGWLMGGLRVFGNLLRSVWEDHSTRLLLGKNAREFIGKELGQGFLPKYFVR
jgi:hypothetical protein